MSLTIAQYVQQMVNREKVIARALGADIFRTDQTTRVANLAVLALLATVVQSLVDKGVVTDQELASRLDAAMAIQWPAEPAEPPPPIT